MVDSTSSSRAQHEISYAFVGAGRCITRRGALSQLNMRSSQPEAKRRSLIGNPVIVGGMPLPSDTPLFLTFVALHVAAGLTCVIAGVVAMLSRKQPGRHPLAGSIYYWALACVFVTMTVLAVSRWAEDYHLFALGSLSFVAATIGRMARRRRWPSWARVHLTGMGASYILLVTAFYVDNGSNLPLWRELPQIAFWILPSLIGAPILLNAFFRHPLVRR